MHQRCLFVCGLLVIAATLVFPKGKEGFDGKWVVDRKASRAMPPPPEDLTQALRVKSDSVEVSSTWKEPAGGMSPLLYVGILTTDLKLSTNGTESENRFGPFTMNAKTTVEGTRMTTVWSVSSTESGSVQGQWVRTLNPNGKQMTLEIQQTASDGQTRTASLVFTRK